MRSIHIGFTLQMHKITMPFQRKKCINFFTPIPKSAPFLSLLFGGGGRGDEEIGSMKFSRKIDFSKRKDCKPRDLGHD